MFLAHELNEDGENYKIFETRTKICPPILATYILQKCSLLF